MVKLYENYNNVRIDEFWNRLDEEFIKEVEKSGDLQIYLDEADFIVFPKFKINPSERKYFIAGSAILYAYPKLIELFNIKRRIGDLDMIIPNKEDWINAGLVEEYNNGGIYRPNDGRDIEVFDVWDPRKAGEEYADVNIRDTQTILKDAKMVHGYYFMSIRDVIDYKFKMDREKELKVNSLVLEYIMGKTMSKLQFLYDLAKIVGFNQAVGYMHATRGFSNREIVKVKQAVERN